MEIKDKADLVLIPLIECIILFLMCLYLLRGYADKKRTSLCIKMLTVLGWFLSFSLVVFIPVDIFMSNNMKQINSGDDAAGEEKEAEPSYMFEWWAFTYWAGNILGYFVIPLVQGYVIAGEFHMMERIQRAILLNVPIFLIYFLCYLILLLLLYVLDQNNSNYNILNT